jgi:hypothetical protein
MAKDKRKKNININTVNIKSVEILPQVRTIDGFFKKR